MNLNTYKFHAIGDVVATIRQYGTTDSYSTEPVRCFTNRAMCLTDSKLTIQGELEHRTPKSRYGRTSKKQFVQQLTQIERREARIQRIRSKIKSRQSLLCPPSGSILHEPEFIPCSGELHTQYHVGKSQNEPVSLPSFLLNNVGDPAIKVSVAFVKGL